LGKVTVACLGNPLPRRPAVRLAQPG